MEQTSDIGEQNDDCSREAVIADCEARVMAGAMRSEMDFILGVISALNHHGLVEEAESFNGLLFLSACGRSVTDPSWDEIVAKRSEGLEWDYEDRRWISQ